jgi:hypothetical protein
MTKQERFHYVANILQEIAGMALEGDHSINYRWAAHVQWFNVWFYPFFADEGYDYAFCGSIRLNESMETDLNRLIEALENNDLLYTINNN